MNSALSFDSTICTVTERNNQYIKEVGTYVRRWQNILEKFIFLQTQTLRIQVSTITSSTTTSIVKITYNRIILVLVFGLFLLPGRNLLSSFIANKSSKQDNN